MSMGIISSILDVIGIDILLRGYPIKLFFMIPPLFPADLTVIPVAFSLAYHYGKHGEGTSYISLLPHFYSLM